MLIVSFGVGRENATQLEFLPLPPLPGMPLLVQNFGDRFTRSPLLCFSNFTKPLYLRLKLDHAVK